MMQDFASELQNSAEEFGKLAVSHEFKQTLSPF